jgi:hypothetical protein
MAVDAVEFFVQLEDVAGHEVELQALLQHVPGAQHVEVLAEEWQLGEARLVVHFDPMPTTPSVLAEHLTRQGDPVASVVSSAERPLSARRCSGAGQVPSVRHVTPRCVAWGHATAPAIAAVAGTAAAVRRAHRTSSEP